MSAPSRQRIESIDLLRGVVMVLMALDHARLYFAHSFFFSNPTDLATTTPLLFCTRWITHFCAPVFVFLAGTGAFLYAAKRNNTRQASWFLFSRGLWLVLVELVIVTFGWMFDVTFSTIFIQVIWVIGVSMIFLSVLVYMPRWSIFIIGFVVVFGHNILDVIRIQFIEAATEGPLSVKAFIYYLLHQRTFLMISPDSAINIIYPLIPWIGLMPLGYVFGSLYRRDFDAARRKRWLLGMGVGCCLLFVVLRAFNIYGDPSPWSVQESTVFSILSFFNVTKYPVSLQFLLVTIGPALVFLYLTENIHNRITSLFVIFGRVPFFFYVIHIYLIHLLAIPAIVLSGYAISEAILTLQSFIEAPLAQFGFDLWVTYVVWVGVVILLFPLCRKYSHYKANNREKKWLSYL